MITFLLFPFLKIVKGLVVGRPKQSSSKTKSTPATKKKSVKTVVESKEEGKADHMA